jgi:hypothetical protein
VITTDVSVPRTPLLCAVLETPGIVEGLTIRTDENGRRQMLVGDLTAGMRLYGKAGE